MIFSYQKLLIIYIHYRGKPYAEMKLTLNLKQLICWSNFSTTLVENLCLLSIFTLPTGPEIDQIYRGASTPPPIPYPPPYPPPNPPLCSPPHSTPTYMTHLCHSLTPS